VGVDQDQDLLGRRAPAEVTVAGRLVQGAAVRLGRVTAPAAVSGSRRL